MSLGALQKPFSPTWLAFGLMALLSFALAFPIPQSQASSFLVPSDTDYKILEGKPYSFIYHPQYKSFVPDLIKANEAFRKLYEEEYRWILDEKAHLILASPQNQILNGFATVLPSLKTTLYVGGGHSSDIFASRSWLYNLLTHETAHLYQLNAKAPYSSFLKSFLGNPMPDIAFPFFTYMVSPNIFMPTFLVEGNATYNESRFGIGGRLYSGEERALFINLAQAGRVEPHWLMNDSLVWPYGRESYTTGAYLQESLAKRYGPERVNSFFKNHAHHYIWPFQINRPFQVSFGEGYRDSIEQLKKDYAKEIENFVRSTEPALHQAEFVGRLSRQNNLIYFMSSNGRNMNRLNTFDLENENFRSERKNLPLGLIFNLNGELHANSSQVVSPTEIKYTLFSSGVKPDRNYLDHFTYDIQGDEWLSVHIPSSFVEAQLYLNNRLIGPAHSNAIIDRTRGYAQAIYFKQSGRHRVLYRQNEALVSFPGFYSRVSDILPDESVLFVSNTPNGSGLFKWNGRHILRLSPSDAIIDAKAVGEDKALVVEITDRGYELKLIGLNPRRERPAWYKYSFEDDREFEIFNELGVFDAGPVSSPNEEKSSVSATQKDYSPLRNLKFSGLDPALGYNSNWGVVASLMARFDDPLEQNRIFFGVNRDLGSTYTGFLGYQNTRNRLSWDIIGLSEQRAWLANDDEESLVRKVNAYSGTTGISYPIYARPQWSSRLTSRYIYYYDRKNPVFERFRRHQDLLTQSFTSHTVNAPTAYKPVRNLSFALGHKYRTDLPWSQKRNIYAGQASGSHHLGYETYLGLQYQAAYVDNEKRDLESRPDIFGLGELYPDITRFPRLTSNIGSDHNELRRFGASLETSFRTPYYFTVFPISLSRTSFFYSYQEFYGRVFKNDESKTLFHEWLIGAEVELLIFHRFPTRIRFAQGENSRVSGTETVVFLSNNIASF